MNTTTTVKTGYNGMYRSIGIRASTIYGVRIPMREQYLYGGIEAGGTKFICALSANPPAIFKETTIKTTTPVETLARVCDFFYPYVRSGQLQTVGLGSFGPVNLDTNSSTYGYITTTPKPGWKSTNILGILRDGMGISVLFEHDVSAAALGEYTWGASQGIDPSLYLTIGTGIGGGIIKDGRPYRGLMALEMGHIHVPHDREKDRFPGNCPYHQDCFEGLAAGPAIHARTGQHPETLDNDDLVWALEAAYIAHALADYAYTLSPRIIILGGGVMRRTFLFDMVRKIFLETLNHYLQCEVFCEGIERYIVPPLLGHRAGVLGAIALARNYQVNGQSKIIGGPTINLEDRC